VMEFAGFPMRVVLNDPETASKAIGGGLSPNGAGDARTQASRAATRVAGQPRQPARQKIAPNKIIEVFGNAIQELSAVNPDGFISLYQSLLSLGAASSATPYHHLLRSNNAPSGASLRVAEAPLVKRVERYQRVLTAFYQD